jgi:hypothetical protein
MATRFYLPASGTAPLASLAYDANWERTTGFARLPTSTSKSNTALASSSRTWAGTTTVQWVWWQFQSAPLKYGYTWTTADTISMVISCFEVNTQCDDHIAYSVRVVNSDGTTVRGTVGLFHATSTELVVTTLTTRIHSARNDGASNFTSYAGDRIIIEIGLHGVTPSASYAQSLRIGDPSATADFALTAGLTTDLCPWVELSCTVAFGNAQIAGNTGTFQFTQAGVLKGKGKLSGNTGTFQFTQAGDLKAKITSIKGYMSSLTLGAEEIVNGGFATDTGWNKGSGWSIHDGRAYSNGTGSFQPIMQIGDCPMDIGLRYRYELDVYATSGILYFYDFESPHQLEISSTGHYIFHQVHNPDFHNFIITWEFWTGSIDNVSVREILGSNCTVSFTATGTLKGKKFLLSGGANHISNGTFDNGTGWTPATGWTISGNVANYLDTNNSVALRQYAASMRSVLKVSTTYIIKFLLAGATGAVRIGITNSDATMDYIGDANYTNGQQAVEFTTWSNFYGNPADLAFYGYTDAANAYTIDNVEIREKGISFTATGALKGKGRLHGSTWINQVYSDNFEGYNVGDLTGQGLWLSASPDGNPPQIINVSGNNLVAAGEAVVEGCAYLNLPFSPNQWAEITIPQMDGLNQIGIALRCSGNGVHNDCNYIAYYIDELYRNIGYVKAGEGLTEIGKQTGAGSGSAGDVLRLEIIGNTARCYRNGVLDTAMSGGGVYDISALGINSGSIGIATWYNGGTTPTAGDNWSGGNILVTGTLTESEGGGTEYGSGSANITFTQNAIPKGKGKLSGNTGAFAFTGTNPLKGRGRLSAAQTVIFSQNAVIKGKGKLIAPQTITFTQNAVLKGKGKLFAPTTIQFTQNAVIRGIGRRSGTTLIQFAQTAILRGKGRLVVKLLGSELLPIGNFDSSAGWTINGTGVYISGGVGVWENCSVSANFQKAGFPSTIGKTFRITYDIKTILAGSLYYVLGGDYNWFAGDHVGKYVFVSAPSTADGTFWIMAAAGTYATIDNISIKEDGFYWAFENSGTIKGRGRLAASTQIQFSGISDLNGRGKLAQPMSFAFTGIGSLRGRGKLIGLHTITFGGLADLNYALSSGQIRADETIIFSEHATLKGKGKLTGNTLVQFTRNAVLKGRGKLISPQIITFTQNAVLKGRGKLSAAQTINFTQNAVIKGGGRLVANTLIQFTENAILKGKGELRAVASITFTSTVQLVVPNALVGSIQLVFTCSAIPSHVVGIVQPINFAFSTSGLLKGRGKLIGVAPILFTQTAQRTCRKALRGVINTVDDVYGNAYVAAFASGNIVVSATVSGILKGIKHFVGNTNLTFDVEASVVDRMRWNRFAFDVIGTLRIARLHYERICGQSLITVEVDGESLITLQIVGNSIITANLQGESVITDKLTDNSIITGSLDGNSLIVENNEQCIY